MAQDIIERRRRIWRYMIASYASVFGAFIGWLVGMLASCAGLPHFGGNPALMALLGGPPVLVSWGLNNFSDDFDAVSKMVVIGSVLLFAVYGWLTAWNRRWLIKALVVHVVSAGVGAIVAMSFMN